MIFFNYNLPSPSWKLLLVCSFFCILPSAAQTTILDWQHSIGGNSYERFWEMVPTSDGGFILGGQSLSDASGDKSENSIGSEDYWVVKINATGTIQWENTIGGSGNDILESIVQTPDGGYFIGGYSNSDISGDKTEDNIGSGADYWVLKLDQNGQIEWQNTIGGDGSEVLSSVQNTSDGGFILGGRSDSDISGDKTENSLGDRDYWIVKLDNTGIIEWQNTIGGADRDLLWNIRQTIDNGYILAGWSRSNSSADKSENSIGEYDYWVVKVDVNGIIQWENTIGGTSFEELYDIQETSDGGFILSGASLSDISGDKSEESRGLFDFWIVKLDNTGDVQWDKTIGGSEADEGRIVIELSDQSGYLVGGHSRSNVSGDKTDNTNGVHDYWILKLDTQGNIIWQDSIGGSDSDFLWSIIELSDNSFALGGYSFSDASGDKTEDSNGDGDYWIIGMTRTLGIDDVLATDIKLWPNPTSNYAEITLDSPCDFQLYAIDGTLWDEGRFENNISYLNLSALPSGLYMLVVEISDQQRIVKRIIKY